MLYFCGFVCVRVLVLVLVLVLGLGRVVFVGAMHIPPSEDFVTAADEFQACVTVRVAAAALGAPLGRFMERDAAAAHSNLAVCFMYSEKAHLALHQLRTTHNSVLCVCARARACVCVCVRVRACLLWSGLQSSPIIRMQRLRTSSSSKATDCGRELRLIPT